MVTRPRDQAIRNIARTRVPGEPHLVKFDETFHPGLIRRCFLAGLTRDATAALIGVRVETLGKWIETDPKLKLMLEGGQRLMDVEVIASIYDQAVGYHDDKGIRRGANINAAKFWAINRMGWRESPKGDGPQDEKITDEIVLAAARDILRKSESDKMADRDRADESIQTIIDAEFSEFDEWTFHPSCTRRS